MLHQVFVEVRDLQPTNERSGSYIVIAVIHQGHSALKITDVMFETLSELHLDREVINVLFELSSGSELVIKTLLHFFETSGCLER